MNGLRGRLLPNLLLAAIVLVSTGAIVLAMRRTSTTFDEIVLIAGGARGYETGRFDIAPEHPPLMQYLYGLPVFMTHPRYPSEAGYDTHAVGYRYKYARRLFWENGNNPERIAFLGRLPAALCALLLVLVTYGFTRGALGPGAGLLAAALVAFLPDVLAHGGVAYNDLPLALTYLLAIWAIDRLVRVPEWRSALLAGAAVALAFAVKFSAVAIGPVAVVLLGLEIFRRRRDRVFLKQLAGAVLFSILACYLVLVAVYRGDFSLAEFRYGLDFTFLHVTEGHGAAAYLLGKTNPKGFWYFFPVAFLFKTPAALHLLAAVALYGLTKVGVRSSDELLGHPLRVPVVGALVFGAALLTSSLDIGFRYALPVLPLFCILIAAGVTKVWALAQRRVRMLIVALVAWAVLAPLSHYPNYLAYVSEYGPGRGRGGEVLIDSSLDWGQGLLQLRDYMREHGIRRIYLSYFGSAEPDGYGIDYEPLYSFGPLLPSRLKQPGAPPPEYIAISATNLQGAYFIGDPFRRFRQIEPEAVIAGSIYLYHITNR